MKRRDYFIFGIISIIVAIVVLRIGKGKENRCTVETQATIVAVEQNSDFDFEKSTYTYSYYPVIEYKIEEKTVRKQCKYLEKEYNTFKIGNQISILYNPDNIEEYIISKNNTIVYTSYFIFAFGIAVLVVGLFKDDSLSYY